MRRVDLTTRLAKTFRPRWPMWKEVEKSCPGYIREHVLQDSDFSLTAKTGTPQGFCLPNLLGNKIKSDFLIMDINERLGLK